MATREADDVIVYCDESGNTGADYLHPDQPFYVLAGWVVQVSAVPEATVLVEKLRSAYCPQRDELKAEVFLKNERRKEGAVRLLSGLGELDSVPLFVIAEKNYCVAGKMVETFLDPAFNDKLSSGFTGDTLTKCELANTLRDHLPEGVLQRFASAYREPSSDAFTNCLHEIIASVRGKINPELAACLEGSVSRIEEITDSEAGGSAFGKISQSVNLPALISFLLLVENLGRKGCIRPRKVVHDEQHVYKEGMNKIFEIHRDAGDFVMEFPHSDVPYSSLTHIPEFEMVDSLESHLVQASDVLAGVVNHLAKLAMAGEKPSPTDIELAKLTMPALMVKDPRVAWAMVSQEFYSRIGVSYIMPMAYDVDVDPKSFEWPPAKASPGSMFPVTRLQAGRAEGSVPTFKADMPMFALVGRKSKAIMTLNIEISVEDRLEKGVALLFTTREKAEDFLGRFEQDKLSEPQDVKGFGPSPPEVVELIDLLEQVSRHVNVVLVDGYDEEPLKLLDVAKFAEGLKNSMERIRRIFSSGLADTINQWEEIDGKRIMSMLASDGKYVACILPDGETYYGTTREEAVEALIAGEGLRR